MKQQEPQQVSPELMSKALDTLDAMCADECIHAEALAANRVKVMECLRKSLEHYVENDLKKHGLPESLQYFVSGLHVGYRLALLEMTAKPSAIN